MPTGDPPPAALQSAPAEASAEVHDRLRTILSISGAAAAWEWRIDEKRIVGDTGFAALYGLTPEQAAAGVSPATFFSIIDPQDLNRIRLAVGGMLRGAEIFAKSFRLLPDQAPIRWVQAHGRCHYDENERPIRFSGVMIDITEQKRLEEQLRIAEAAGGVGTFEHIDGFATASVSVQFCGLLGLHASADLPVRTINSVVMQDDPPIIDLAPRSQPDSASRIELRIVRPDTGEVRWLMRRGEYLRDSDTSVIRFIGVIYDITDAKHTEAQLRTLNERLESRVDERTRERDRIWRVSQDLLGVADHDGNWISVNPAWHAVLGWSEADIVGKTSEWLEHPDDRAVTREQMERLSAGQRTFGFENRYRHRNGGYRWLWWTAVLEEGRIYAVARDVTSEKEAASALRQAEEQLRQSQKMEAVGQLTGGLAHDFNNLLTSITGSLELLQARMAQGQMESVPRYIAAAHGAANRAAALTHRLLAFSRRQTLDPKPTSANRLIAEMEELIRRTVGPEIAVDIVMAQGAWSTLCDPNQLENALLNLCINARDAMPGGGLLTIWTSNTELGDGAAREQDMLPGQYIEIRVTDTGTGMTAETMARAFDPFFTTKPLGQGTGLGLSMIYGFVKQSGGQVRINSAVGRGTTMHLYLPRHRVEEADERRVMQNTAVPRAGDGETVLVVDDERMIRMLITEVLEDLGYAAIEAPDGALGLQILQAARRVDLLITDVGLPGGMNGRQLADLARLGRPDLKVLFITGYADQAAVGGDDLAPGMQVMTKPFALQALAARIKTMLTGA